METRIILRNFAKFTIRLLVATFVFITGVLAAATVFIFTMGFFMSLG